MVLVASASDHRHRRAAKSTPSAASLASPSTSKVPAAKASAGAGLHGFSFSWGARRRLRCSKDGAPAYESASPSPAQHPHTPSPDKEKPPAAQPQDPPQRPRSLRPVRHAASSRPDGAGQAALQSPNPAKAHRPNKRGFAVALTREEIARDFAAIRRCATRPVPAARRSKKNKKPPKVQKVIDKLFPGLLLLDVDLDYYKIEERGQKR